MESFHIADLETDLHASDDAVTYHEFLAEESMSVGLYRLDAGADDPQTPHAEDEVYHVLSGRATLRVEGAECDVGPGSVVFVEREADHRFVDVEEDLTALVFFAPEEGTDGG